jgi:hypothetical protein
VAPACRILALWLNRSKNFASVGISFLNIGLLGTKKAILRTGESRKIAGIHPIMDRLCASP